MTDKELKERHYQLWDRIAWYCDHAPSKLFYSDGRFSITRAKANVFGENNWKFVIGHCFACESVHSKCSTCHLEPSACGIVDSAYQKLLGKGGWYQTNVDLDQIKALSIQIRDAWRDDEQ